MNTDAKSWPMFNPNTLRPLNDEEIDHIRQAAHRFNRLFNEGLSEDFRYVFTASPRNLADLDYDFYELGGVNWYRDHGHGFTCAWGEILTQSFGFEWAAMQGAESLRDCVLRHQEASYVFFPWQTLWSIVESSGNQFEKAEGAWIRILKNVDSALGIPASWHPAVDAIRDEETSLPAKVIRPLRTLYDESDRFFEILSLEPYDWNDATDWDKVADWLNSQVKRFP